MKYKPVAQKQLFTAARSAKLLKQIEESAEFEDAKWSTPNVGAHKQSIWQMLPDDTTFQPVYTAVQEFMTQMNDTHFGFDLTEFEEEIRVCRYKPGYHHAWHVDYQLEDASKLALSVPLNDEYEGGQFQMLDVDPTVTQQKVGRGIVFPAYHGHRVTKVTSGVRYVLLAWMTGPRFV